MTVPCRAILFDCDGVLVDSDTSVHLSWSRWAQDRGLDPQAVLAIVHGRRSADSVDVLVAASERERALADIDRYEVEDADSVTPVPGAVSLLASLPAGSWAVVTSGRRPLATARLAAARLRVPSVLVCADDVHVGKPDPAGYVAAAAALGVPPADCLVLEDSAAGVAAGAASGAAVVGVGERALESDAPLVVRDLRGLSWDGGGLRIPFAALVRAPA